jgi:hypothetical protein
MQIREQVKDIFGTADTKTLLDEDVYTDTDLKKDKIRLKRERQQLEKEMDEYVGEYKELIREGADAGEHRRPQLAQQAKMAKKKYKIKKQQYKKNSVVMATLVSIEGARELQEMHGGDKTELEDLLHESDVDAQQVQEDIMDDMIQFELDMEVMQEVQQSLDIDILGTEMDVGATEEEEMMAQFEQGDLDEEKLDLDEQVDAEADADDMSLENEMSVDVDIEDDVGL